MFIEAYLILLYIYLMPAMNLTTLKITNLRNEIRDFECLVRFNPWSDLFFHLLYSFYIIWLFIILSLYSEWTIKEAFRFFIFLIGKMNIYKCIYYIYEYINVWSRTRFPEKCQIISIHPSGKSSEAIRGLSLLFGF
jgi:hypothetical protein